MSQLFETITDALVAYGTSLAVNPVVKVHYNLEPEISDVGLSKWRCTAIVECYGEIAEDGEPKLLESVTWEGEGEGSSEATVDLYTKVQNSLADRAELLRQRLSTLTPLIVEPQAGRVVNVEATLHRR